MFKKIILTAAAGTVGALSVFGMSLGQANAAPAPPVKEESHYDYARQENGYFCAPAAVRIALTATGQNPDQGALATRLKTTVNGTDSIAEPTRVMNEIVGDWYHSETIPTGNVSPAQIDKLRADVRKTIESHHVIVANIVGGATDTAGQTHTYAGGHYLNVVGFGGDIVIVADAAAPDTPRYEMTTAGLAQWIATRGYSTV